MDLLNSMTVFVRVVACENFTTAADQLGISTTMVSNHIRGLETRLGAKLLHRTTRRQSLTDIGRAYYEQCVDILSRIELAETSAREQRANPKGLLRISAVVSLSAHTLVPLIAQYVETYPEVEVELIFSDEVVNLIEGGFDAGIRYGDLPDSGLVARELGRTRLVPCAAPAYLDSHGVPESLADLQGHTCLAFHNTVAQWQWKFGGGDPTCVATKGRFSTNNMPALRTATLAGLGIAMLPRDLADADIREGRLIPLLEAFGAPDRPLHIVYMQDRLMTRKLSSLIDFLVAHFPK
ncbi:LysR family transcriptional regulator [Cupriavidus plantarum]|uniref:LysR family transcriptional regulator n=1 Tax=Cupriavidus plantarum TaxID=942865 RepID=UPI000E24812A|nr:LysR family transcriptional regulator [Cupriavidus plantarum]REE89283.1 LysR family transcriptional regulator [Cupriavidus plantarum]